jgi:hypothetical protein
MKWSKYKTLSIATPESVYRDDTVYVVYEDEEKPYRIVRKSQNALILKSKEDGVKKAFWNRKKEKYRVEGKYLLLN